MGVDESNQEMPLTHLEPDNSGSIAISSSLLYGHVIFGVIRMTSSENLQQPIFEASSGENKRALLRSSGLRRQGQI